MRTRPNRVVAVLVSVFGIISCGPEPTTPADTDLSGTWESNVSMYTLEDITMKLVQEPRGVVSGGWTARGTGGGGHCPPATPCPAFGNVIGRNNVAWVEIELLGAARFEGGLVEPNRLRGILSVVNTYDTITFVRR